MNPTNRNWFFLFSANFLGIFNDNLLKNCIIFIAVTWSRPEWMSQSQLISLVSGSLVIPYIFLSPISGRLSRLNSKVNIFKLLKLIEIPIMATACIAFHYKLIWLAITMVLLMGIQSCLYSPAKYGLIRDIGGNAGVSFGSGTFEAMAFMGILLGTMAASIVSDHYVNWALYAGYLLLAAFGYCCVAQLRVKEQEEIPEGATSNRPIRFLITSYHFAKQYPQLNMAVYGSSLFWLIGGLLQMNLVIHCTDTLALSNTETGIVMALAAIGIALGTYTTGRLSHHTVRKELIPIGLGLMSALLLLVAVTNPSPVVFGVIVFGIAFSGGMFQVPCLAMVQQAETGRKIADVVAYVNLITFAFVLLGTVLFSATTALTNESSIAVFWVITTISFTNLIWFIYKLNEVRKLQ